MLKNQRHEQILDILKKEGFAEVRTLGERLYASQPTVRRDLDYLEKQGYVRRSHGGAILADDKIHTPISFRRGTRTQEKVRICRLAATLIPPGSLIFTDASTTASHLAEFLKEEAYVTIVTNGYTICRTLAEQNLNTFSTGGRLLRDSMAFVGKRAEETVQQFNAEIFFFSSSSLSEDGCVSDYSEEETALRQTMSQQSKKTVFLCDSAKIGRVAAHHAFSPDEIDAIVTDQPLSEELLSKLSMTLHKEGNGAYLYEK